MNKDVRGNNWLSNLLNKDLDGKFKISKKFTVTAFSVLFLGILFSSINYLGLKEGFFFTIGFSLLAFIINIMSEHQLKQNSKVIKKHPWKAFDDK